MKFIRHNNNNSNNNNNNYYYYYYYYYYYSTTILVVVLLCGLCLTGPLFQLFPGHFFQSTTFEDDRRLKRDIAGRKALIHVIRPTV